MGEQRSDSKLTSGSAGRIYQSGEKIYQMCFREKEKEAQQRITIDGYECVLVDEWGSEKEKYLLGNNIEDSSFYYAQVNGKTFEYDHKPERSEVEDDYINAIAEEDIDRHEAEVFSRFEGTDGIAELDRSAEISVACGT